MRSWFFTPGALYWRRHSQGARLACLRNNYFIILSQYQFQDDGITNAKLQLQLGRLFHQAAKQNIELFWLNKLDFVIKQNFCSPGNQFQSIKSIWKKWMFITEVEQRISSLLISTKHKMKLKNSEGIVFTSFCWKTNMLHDNIPIWWNCYLCSKPVMLKFAVSSNKDVFKYVLCY